MSAPLSAKPVPGDGFLALRDGLGVLCAGTGEAVDRIVALLDEVAAAGSDGTSWCDRLESMFPAASAPGLVAWGPIGDSEAVEVIVHGPAWVDVATTAAEQRLVLRQQQVTALRAGVPGALTALTASLGSPGPVDPSGPWRIDSGVVPASAVVLGAVVDSVPAPSPAPVWVSKHAQPEAVAPPAPAVAPPAPVPPAAEPVAFVPDPVAAPTPAPEPVPAPAPEPEPVVVTAPPEPPPAVEEDPAPTSVEPMPVVPDGSAVPEPGPVVDRSLPFESVLLLGPPDQPTVPPAAAPPKAEPLPTGAAAVAATGEQDSRAVILGVYCKNGHFDDPDARYCAVCGISMQQQTLYPRPGPRPPLGVLILDDGAIFSLDSDYVLGREPTVHPDVRDNVARPLRVSGDSSHVSRAHLRVTLDGWRVTVTDLQSANGTAVTLPKQNTWQRLEPGRPFTLVPGTRVGLGRREIRYESHRNT